MVRLTDRPDRTLDVYCGRKTTIQQQQQLNLTEKILSILYGGCSIFFLQNVSSGSGEEAFEEFLILCGLCNHFQFLIIIILAVSIQPSYKN